MDRYTQIFENKDMVADLDTALNSFEVQDTLNPALWNEDQTLKEDVRVDLLQIANDFYDSLKIRAEIHDVILTGSSANFNWSEFSDLDCHIILAYKDVDNNTDLVSNYFDAKKKLWTLKYDVEIHGYPVEMYVQDVDDNLVAAGVYSIINNSWLSKPEKIETRIDMKAVRQKAEHLMSQIDDAIASGDPENSKKFMKKLKRYRDAGLAEGGELSVENTVFKTLRRDGYLDKIKNFEVSAYNKLHSIT